jgi:hypothetical protein
MIVYKLTDQNLRTHNGFQYVVDVEARPDAQEAGKGDLCGPGWLPAYEHPLIAAVMHPIHRSFANPILWRADAPDSPVKKENQSKLGVVALTLRERVAMPEISREQRVRFAIYCAQAVLPKKPWAGKWSKWAQAWLSSKDRSRAYAATADAAYAATYAAYAADAAYAATYAAYAADAAYTATYAAYAADAAYTAAAAAAYTATYAAAAALKKAAQLDILSLIKRAIKDEAEYAAKAAAGADR